MIPVLVDSSAFLSLEDPRERSHPRSISALRTLVEESVLLIATNFIFDETYTLILTRLGRQRAVRWGDNFLGGKLVRVVRVEQTHEERAWQIIHQYNDKDFSYTDATSFAVAEDLDIDRAFSLDEHFHQFGRFDLVP
ncbi:MAG: PIN domain-containing protein [Actinomycetota bacterium]